MRPTIFWLVPLLYMAVAPCVSASGERGLPANTALLASSPTGSTAAACSKETCSPSGGLFDVNNPAYNVKEVIKNALLIEDHLSSPKKYCKQCLVKREC